MTIIQFDHDLGDTPYFISARKVALALPLDALRVNSNTNEAEYLVEAEHNPGCNIYGLHSLTYCRNKDLFKSAREAELEWKVQFPNDEITRYTFPWTWNIKELKC